MSQSFWARSLVALCAAAPAAQAARSEFFGIAQGALDAPDAQQMADVGIEDGALPAQMEGGGADQGLLRLGRKGLAGRRPCLARNPAGPVRVGLAAVGRQWGRRPSPARQSADIQAWQNFLKAAVARYGPGGSFWANGYRQRFGDDAVPLPIQSWQIWNEPNLKKFFAPGTTVAAVGPTSTPGCFRSSRDAIKSRDPQARSSCTPECPATGT